MLFLLSCQRKHKFLNFRAKQCSVDVELYITLYLGRDYSFIDDCKAIYILFIFEFSSSAELENIYLVLSIVYLIYTVK